MPKQTGSAIKYGKVEVFSADQPLKDVYAVFANIMKAFGYPEDEESLTEEVIDSLLLDEQDDTEEGQDDEKETPPWMRDDE